jgi:hypothetical protein
LLGGWDRYVYELVLDFACYLRHPIVPDEHVDLRTDCHLTGEIDARFD